MPEHDVVKHTKAIYDNIANPDKDWRHKLKDIFIEVLIIVFAISLSLLLERWRENAHERSIEKKFLTGLRSDLHQDIEQLKTDSISYQKLYVGWQYMRNIAITDSANIDSLALYGQSLITSTEFIPNSSRFEALKSSGQLDVIEDDSLQNLILRLYQHEIVILKASTDFITNFKSQRILPFLAKNLTYQKYGVSNMPEVLKMQEMRNYLFMGNASIEIIQRYHDVINTSGQIITMISEQYKK